MHHSPQHVEPLLDALHDHRLALFNDAELRVLTRALAALGTDDPHSSSRSTARSSGHLRIERGGLIWTITE
jgi:hypothetical protein